MEQHLRTAEIVAVGTELTTGATRDTNAGDLARELTAMGVEVLRMTDLPDELSVVTDTFRQAAARADLVVSTGGLGPTPDDLTREAIAAACGAEPVVDAATEAWLAALFERRGAPMPESNRKQAWLIPGATALRNEHGTAPGWWVERPDGGVIVALPGPPAEMWPMWRSAVVPRLNALRVGLNRAARTLRLTGVGESVLVGMVGESVLRGRNPQVATYARSDAVDLRVTAVGTPGGPTALELVNETVGEILPRIADHVFAEGDEGWPEALERVLGERRLATLEVGTGGQLLALLGDASFLQFGQLLGSTTAAEHAAGNLWLYAERVREMSGAHIGLAVHASAHRADTRVRVAIATATGTTTEERTAFLVGAEGRRRAALAACAVLWRRMRSDGEKG
ncbi:MAG TPA: molybdopterin-binding protein [Candidatus Caenarcaniphilales bacterium]|nr:molybdopterin-binding protein [Candidatus Caenarcaniphilales bacterium]